MCVRRYLGFVLLVWFPGALHAQSATQPCRAPRLSSGYLVPEQYTYHHETNLTYACDNGHKPAVEGWWATITCLDGTWSHEPQCIDEKACMPPTILNAMYTVNTNGWYEERHIIRIKCNEGYEHKDSDATAECVNGAWTSVPICEKSIHACGELPKIPHVVIINQEYQELFPGDTEVQYECEDGYTVEGADKKSIYCFSGNWTEGPTCNRGTGPGAGQGVTAEVETGGPSAGSGTQPEIDDTRRTGQGGSTGGGTGGGHSTSTGTGTPAGGGSGTRPDPGHSGGSSGTGTPTGGGSSTSSGSNERNRYTTITRCGAYPIVPNGDVVREEPMFLKYQCNAFYTQVGLDIVWCYSDGSWSKLPFCDAAFCVLNPPITNRILPGAVYIKEGEKKIIPCIWNNYFSRVQCNNRRLSISQCKYISMLFTL
ncbi:sushi, von Willebrand factor type A, EGF and pentraxin domain-containing protein 1-like [Sebastes fasciatus]|uniref:sushi, von Willebrand factor type A, EGF and pentraxin domain-containing protein 1-like n=1 Tax=Sebastes fasciatus TaxID=394691 RepID=UPI003D9E7C54